MKEIKSCPVHSHYPFFCSFLLSLFSQQDQPPLPVEGVGLSVNTRRNNSQSCRLATKVIEEGVGRWGCRRQRIGQRGSQNLFLKTTKFSFFPCNIHLGRYNMIFVETSAKDNTGVEQVSFDSTAESDPNSPFLCDQHIHLDCRLSWSWWTECYRAQASGALAKVSPPLLLPKLGRPSWGESKHHNAQNQMFLFPGLNKEEPPVPRLVVELR